MEQNKLSLLLKKLDKQNESIDSHEDVFINLNDEFAKSLRAVYGMGNGTCSNNSGCSNNGHCSNNTSCDGNGTCDGACG